MKDENTTMKAENPHSRRDYSRDRDKNSIPQENRIPQAHTTTNKLQNRNKKENNCEENTDLRRCPQRERQPPSRFGYGTIGASSGDVFNEWQNPAVQTHDFIPPSSPFFDFLPTSPAFGYPQMYCKQPMFIF